MDESTRSLESISPVRKTGWLFRMTCGLAVLLTTTVLLAPLLDSKDPAPEGWRRIVALFARDVTLRRTSLASAAGLLVSACVFFQSAREDGKMRERYPQSG